MTKNDEHQSRPAPDPIDAFVYREISQLRNYMFSEMTTYINRELGHNDRLYGERWQAQKDAIEVANASTRAALDKAEDATNQRFETVERERKILSEHTNECLPRSEYDNRHQAINDKIDGAYMTLSDKINSVQSIVDQMQATIRGQRQLGNLLFALIAAAGVVVAIVAGVIAVLKP